MTGATQSISHPADFRSPAFLRHHIQTILDFYYPRCLNTEDGGYYNSFRDDGSIADAATQHLVSLTRLIVNFSAAAMLTDRAEYRAAAEHGLAKLHEDFRDPVHGGYFWILDRRHPRDDSKQCYGHAFALLAYAVAAQAGVAGASSALSETFAVLEERFWSSADRLYAEEFRRNWSPLSPYRGQNCNMHMTEALLAAYEATGDRSFLARAGTIAHRICVDLASRSDNLIWEHYSSDWSHDWDYNRASPKDLFRPHGFLPGHFVEWAKLLLVLERHDPQVWMLPRATALFDAALTWGADLAHGGLHYAFAPGGERLDLDRVLLGALRRDRRRRPSRPPYERGALEPDL